ncbi:DUF6479 family protein [Streptomyces sp. NPDC086989]|uniref:DUF6479 family protein n=1 Tax=Streptomyces sp. NPDC086989 TaxID=3365764 RepID=UPI0037F7811E
MFSFPFLAAGTAGAGLLAVGVVVAVVLIAAVWWGIRRRADRTGPTAASRTVARPHHVDEHREPEPDAFPDGAGRLSPHEMKGYGNLGSRPAAPPRDETQD